MKKKIVKFLLLSFIGISSFSGCDNSNNSSSSNKSTIITNSNLEKMMKYYIKA